MMRISEDLNDEHFLPILGGGIHKLEPGKSFGDYFSIMCIGQITDDSEMALCLARCLNEDYRFAQKKVVCSYVHWMQTGPIFAGVTTKNAFLYSKLKYSYKSNFQMSWTFHIIGVLRNRRPINLKSLFKFLRIEN